MPVVRRVQELYRTAQVYNRPFGLAIDVVLDSPQCQENSSRNNDFVRDPQKAFVSRPAEKSCSDNGS